MMNKYNQNWVIFLIDVPVFAFPQVSYMLS